MSELNWKVIYTGSRQEKAVAARLEKAEVEVYLPLSRKLRQWSDRKKWIEFPLFSGYLFVRPDKLQREEILQQPGVIAYLRYNGKDATVRENEIEIIRNMINSGYSLETIHTPDDFEPGDRVMVAEGPLAGQWVDIHRRNNQEMFLVSFDTLGQSIKVTLPYHVLEKQKP